MTRPASEPATAHLYRPGSPRLPIGQYRVTALITGDAVGPETLSWLVADRLNNMAAGAITGRVELIETLGPGSNDDGPAGWLAALERRVGPTTSYAEARQAERDADPVQIITAPDAYPADVCGEHTGIASNRCLLTPSHPGRHDDDPPQTGREKDFVREALDAVIEAVNRLGASGLHGQVMRGEVITAIHRVGDHYGVIP